MAGHSGRTTSPGQASPGWASAKWTIREIQAICRRGLAGRDSRSSAADLRGTGNGLGDLADLQPEPERILVRQVADEPGWASAKWTIREIQAICRRGLAGRDSRSSAADLRGTGNGLGDLADLQPERILARQVADGNGNRLRWVRMRTIDTSMSVARQIEQRDDEGMGHSSPGVFDESVRERASEQESNCCQCWQVALLAFDTNSAIPFRQTPRMLVSSALKVTKPLDTQVQNKWRSALIMSCSAH